MHGYGQCTRTYERNSMCHFSHSVYILPLSKKNMWCCIVVSSIDQMPWTSENKRVQRSKFRVQSQVCFVWHIHVWFWTHKTDILNLTFHYLDTCRRKIHGLLVCCCICNITNNTWKKGGEGEWFHQHQRKMIAIV